MSDLPDQESNVPDSVWAGLDEEIAEPGTEREQTAEDEQPGREAEESSPEEEDVFEQDGSSEDDKMPGDMYAAELLKFEDGTSMTVEQAKDAVRDYRSREAEMEKTQTELLRDMAQVNQILANGGPMNQQQVDELNTYRANYLAQQHEVMMRAHPEWKDQSVMQQARSDMIEIAQRYGKSAEMVGGITNAMDLQMLHDLTRLTKERENAARKLKEKVSAKPDRSPGRKPAPRRGAKNNQLGKFLESSKGAGESADWNELDKLL